MLPESWNNLPLADDGGAAKKGEKNKMSYMTAGKLQAFEALMKEVPGHNHYDSGCDGICPECRSCCFHRPYWKYQTWVFEECPYSPVKLSTLRCQPVTAREG